MTQISKGCPCDLCAVPFEVPAFIGAEESALRQEAYRARRAIHAEAVGRPVEKMVIRGTHD